ncbi:hypothetical protein [Cellvibrio mixtus]|uniref:hypothetical protein n=1 Tax=Cellvibrio mixtus TaxID=39650 RepID=UPI00058736A8|nr:hypothetical protein [Cellvibrio mixtus]
MISVSTTALYNAYSSDMSTRKTVSTIVDEKTPETSSSESPTAIVNLSNEAISALEKYKASATVDQFLKEHGREVYESTMNSLKGYPENLASKLNDKSLSEKELTAIQNALTEREMNAFMKYARQDPPDMKMFFEKYVEYLDTLSPEELLSQRYIGQRAVAEQQYQHFAREQGETPDDLSSAQHPITSLFELLKEVDFTVEDKNGFLKKYEDKVSSILNREGNENLKPLSDEAVEKLNNLFSIISAAHEGDKAAFEKLQSAIKPAEIEKRT